MISRATGFPYIDEKNRSRPLRLPTRLRYDCFIDRYDEDAADMREAVTKEAPVDLLPFNCRIEESLDCSIAAAFFCPPGDSEHGHPTGHG